MKSRRNKNNKSRKNTSLKRRNTRRHKKRGGIINPFLASSSYGFANKIDCSNMNVDVIKDMSELHRRYQKCCPKNILGFKNSSVICKKMDTNFKKLWKEENDSHAAFGYDTTPTITP